MSRRTDYEYLLQEALRRAEQTEEQQQQERQAEEDV
jgi:hypothetical protein